VSRYYKVAIGANTTAPSGSTVAPSGNAGATWTNQVNGLPDPNAQQVELDLPVAAYAEPAGPALPHVKIWGVGLQQISQAADFVGAPISVYGGMQAGLPLATAAAGQAGLLVSGTVFQAFGNWQGVNQTLDLVIQPGPPGGTQDQPAGLSFLWKKGVQLSAMLKQALAQAYPGVTANVNIAQNLVLPADEQGFYGTLPQFANYVKAISQQLGGGTYPGVDIVIKDGAFNVFDGSSKTSPKQLNFQDQVGQATWIDAFTITWNMVMRGDVPIGDVVTLPPLTQYQAVTTQASQSQARNQAAFQGSWTVNFVRHVGNSRAPDASAWITNFRAYSNAAPPSATSPLGATSS
jgi:hypothetical protein